MGPLLAGLAIAALAGCGGSVAPKARLTVTPAAALWDRARTVVVSHLQAGQQVILRARTSLPDGIWASSARFKADDRGVVDVARQAPVSGSYSGVSAMGLLWSEKLVAPKPGPYNGRATTMISARVEAKVVASARMTQFLTAPGVTEHVERVSSSGFFGVYYAPRSTAARAPAVVLWAGSKGGLSGTPSEAALLASHGIPALALAYFNEPGLPCRLEKIPLEYFARAIRWLRSRRDVDPRRVWVWGGSRGSEPALLVAAHFPALVRGVVAWAPSALAEGAYPGRCQTTGAQAPAWTLNGKPIPISSPIPAQKIKANVLLLAGGQDIVAPSSVYAREIMAKLPHNGAAHRYLYYPKAGHGVLSIPFTPLMPSDGGTVASDNAAWISDWPAAIKFITSH